MSIVFPYMNASESRRCFPRDSSDGADVRPTGCLTVAVRTPYRARVAASKIVNPADAILPVVLLDTKRGTVKRFLGTAFFFSPKPKILSVAHVLNVQPGPDEAVVVPRRELPDADPGVSKRQNVMARISNVRIDPRHDLAVADVSGVTNFEHFRLRSDDPPGVTSVMTFDLASRITYERLESGDVLPT